MKGFKRILIFVLAAALCVLALFACSPSDEPEQGPPDDPHVGQSPDGTYYIYSGGEYIEQMSLELNGGTFVEHKTYGTDMTTEGSYTYDDGVLVLTVTDGESSRNHMRGTLYAGVIKAEYYDGDTPRGEYVFYCKKGSAPSFPKAPDGAYILNRLGVADDSVFIVIDGTRFEYTDYGVKTPGDIAYGEDGNATLSVADKTFATAEPECDGSLYVTRGGRSDRYCKTGVTVENKFEFYVVEKSDEQPGDTDTARSGEDGEGGEDSGTDGQERVYGIRSMRPGTCAAVTVPDSYEGCAVVEIGDDVFVGYAGARIEIPDSVTAVGRRAFMRCAAQVSWGESPAVASIGERAFCEYAGSSIDIPDSVVSLGKYAFDGTAAELRFGEHSGITMIFPYALSGYAGASLRVPDSVEIIGYCAFAGCRANIEWGERPSLTTIDTCAFIGCTFESFYVPYRVNCINSMAFYDCKALKSVRFADPKIIWYVSDLGGENGNTVSVMSEERNAKYLTDTYLAYGWVIRLGDN